MNVPGPKTTLGRLRLREAAARALGAAGRDDALRGVARRGSPPRPMTPLQVAGQHELGHRLVDQDVDGVLAEALVVACEALNVSARAGDERVVRRRRLQAEGARAPPSTRKGEDHAGDQRRATRRKRHHGAENAGQHGSDDRRRALTDAPLRGAGANAGPVTWRRRAPRGPPRRCEALTCGYCVVLPLTVNGPCCLHGGAGTDDAGADAADRCSRAASANAAPPSRPAIPFTGPRVGIGPAAALAGLVDLEAVLELAEHARAWRTGWSGCCPGACRTPRGSRG